MNKILGVLIFGIVTIFGSIVVYDRTHRETTPNSSTLGSLSSTEIYSPYVNFGGVQHEYREKDLATATTTPCALQSPSATSSLLHASLKITTGTSTATTWTVARATTPYATTTAFQSFSLGSGANGYMMVGTASTTIDGLGIIPPNQYIVWGVAGTAIAD